MIRIQSEPIRIEDFVAALRSDADGAVAVFLGTVRNHHEGRKVTRLEYHAYQRMAEAELERIERETVERFGVTALVAIHRTGMLEVGDVSVLVAAASGHRGEAFDACRYAMEAIKQRAPIWKKEWFEDGQEWVGAAR